MFIRVLWRRRRLGRIAWRTGGLTLLLLLLLWWVRGFVSSRPPCGGNALWSAVEGLPVVDGRVVVSC
jgi:hypothetical protein